MYPSVRARRLLVAFLAVCTLCMLLVVSANHVDFIAGHNAKRELGARIYIEDGNGNSPAVLVVEGNTDGAPAVVVVEDANDDVGEFPAVEIDGAIDDAEEGTHLANVITLTSIDTPEPIYGTDDDQPTLPPSNASVSDPVIDVNDSKPNDNSAPSETLAPTDVPTTPTDSNATNSTLEPSPVVIIIANSSMELPTPPRPSSDLNPRLFGTKTMYWNQRSLFMDDPRVKQLQEKTAQELRGLTLLQVQQVTRHGTRFPTKSNLIALERLVDKLQRDYATSIPVWLQHYKLPYNASIAGTLAPPGFDELEEFGKRTRATIDDALPRRFADDAFIVQHTYKSRTKDSAASFVKGFFTNPDDVKYTRHSKKKDRLLRFFDECPRYSSEVTENATAVAELTAFRASARTVQHLEVAKKQLGVPPTANITQADLKAIHAACAFDIALYDTYADWCSLLNKDIAVALDFADDLENFYENGPGHTINYEIASVLLQDIYASMQRLLHGKCKVVGNFRFAHSETTLPLMTLLGYGDRTPLRATFTPDEIAFRGFRSSVLAPLGANIDFRLFASKSDASKHVVQVLVNEKVAPVPGCNGKVFCDLLTVAKLWGHYLTEYDFDAECKL